MTQVNPYALPLLLTAIPLIWIVGLTWRLRADFTARMFILNTIGSIGLLISYAFELSSTSLDGIAFWLGWEYFFHWCTIAWFLFAVGYSGYAHLVTRRRVAFLLIVPVIILILVWTNRSHGLIWSRMAAVEVEGLVMFDRDYGPLFWVWIVYIYGLVAAGTILLIRRALQDERLFRDQIIVLVTAVSLPWIGSIITILDWVPFPLLDLTPYGIALSCLPVYLVLRRYRLFEFMPAALEVVLTQMPDGMIVCDTQGRILKANPAARRLIPNETLNNILLRDALPDLQAPRPDMPPYELVIGSASYDVRTFPLRSRRGMLTGYTVILQDVTLRKQAEQHALALVAERERASALATIVQDVAHDMRTPLSVMVMNLNVIDKLITLPEMPPEVGAKLRKRVDIMLDYEGRLRQVLTSMSEVLYATNTPPVTFSTQDFNRLVVEQVDDHHLWAEEQGIVLTTRLHSSPLPVSMDEPHLRRALDKMIENALIYTRRGGHVEVVTCLEGNRVICEVCDTGIGISEADLPRVFEDFFRADRARPFTGGAGLGLPIARRIIERHGGTITATSILGQGSTFRISLPLAA